MQSQQRGPTKAPHSVDSNLAKLEVDTFAQENAPIKRVVLYKHGIALFERWESNLNSIFFGLDQDLLNLPASFIDCRYSTIPIYI